MSSVYDEYVGHGLATEHSCLKSDTHPPAPHALKGCLFSCPHSIYEYCDCNIPRSDYDMVHNIYNNRSVCTPYQGRDGYGLATEPSRLISSTPPPASFALEGGFFSCPHSKLDYCGCDIQCNSCSVGIYHHVCNKQDSVCGPSVLPADSLTNCDVFSHVSLFDTRFINNGFSIVPIPPSQCIGGCSVSGPGGIQDLRDDPHALVVLNDGDCDEAINLDYNSYACSPSTHACTHAHTSLSPAPLHPERPCSDSVVFVLP